MDLIRATSCRLKADIHFRDKGPLYIFNRVLVSNFLITMTNFKKQWLLQVENWTIPNFSKIPRERERERGERGERGERRERRERRERGKRERRGQREERGERGERGGSFRVISKMMLRMKWNIVEKYSGSSSYCTWIERRSNVVRFSSRICIKVTQVNQLIYLMPLIFFKTP